MGKEGSFHPRTAEEVCAIIAEVSSRGEPLEVRGGGSKRPIGRAERATAVLHTKDIAGAVDYDPSELVVTVPAGMALKELEERLRNQGQMLAFEPFDHGPMFGEEPGAATIGGIVAAGVAGARRLSAGGVRDYLLGFKAVSGRGEAFAAGGRVVKNVTGYDLPKLICGSWGQLCMLTEVTLKVVPRPEITRTLAVTGLSDEAAVGLMVRALRAPLHLSGGAHLPPQVNDGAAITYLRLEGFAASVRARTGMLLKLIGTEAETVSLKDEQSASLWHDLSSAKPLAETQGLWRLCVPQTEGARVTKRLAERGARWFYDWGGGLIWLSAPEDLAPAAIRAAAAQAGGHGMLVRGSAALRASTPIRHPQPEPVAALEKRIKAAFDPAGILDPGRFGDLDAD